MQEVEVLEDKWGYFRVKGAFGRCLTREDAVWSYHMQVRVNKMLKERHERNFINLATFSAEGFDDE